MFGILNTNKPTGCTSRSVVGRIHRLVRPDKVGHAGTLDPLASGVLVVCVSSATRLIEYVQRMPKHYRATFQLGRSSESDDVETQVTMHSAAPHPTRNDLQRALPQFVGRISQVPPAFSAVRVAGKRAYSLARRGVTPELQPREIEIYALSIVGYEFPELTLDIECGSGTYVRSLGRDLARAVGTEAVMSGLVRTAIGGFRVEDALAVDDLQLGDIQRSLQSPLAALGDLPRVILAAEQGDDLQYGKPARVSLSDIADADIAECAAVDANGRLLAILRKKGKHWFPAVNFCAI